MLPWRRPGTRSRWTASRCGWTWMCRKLAGPRTPGAACPPGPGLNWSFPCGPGATAPRSLSKEHRLKWWLAVPSGPRWRSRRHGSGVRMTEASGWAYVAACGRCGLTMFRTSTTASTRSPEMERANWNSGSSAPMNWALSWTPSPCPCPGIWRGNSSSLWTEAGDSVAGRSPAGGGQAPMWASQCSTGPPPKWKGCPSTAALSRLPWWERPDWTGSTP